MKKIKILCLLLCLTLMLQSAPFSVFATETTEPSAPTVPEETQPYVEPPTVDYGGVPITNGCRTINGMTPLGGTDKILKSAQAAFIYEMNTETIIYAYNPDVRLYPGSLAKIMTALLAIEMGDMDQEVTFSTKWNQSLPAQSITCDLKEGEVTTLGVLVYWTMLYSANDAALNIAGIIGGSQEGFVELMNQRAAQMGCTDTHFTNAHGLDDPEQYTTARDMVKIVLEATKNETFCTVFGEDSYRMPPTNKYDKDDRIIASDNHLIYQLILPKFNRKEVTGGKTSSTGGSGSSLVCTAEDHDMKLICLVMGTERETASNGSVTYYGNFEEMFDLLDFAFDGFRIKRVLYPDLALSQFPVMGGECQVVGYPDVAINSVLPIDCTLNNLILRYTVEGGGLTAPVAKDQKIATVQVWYRTSCVTEAEVFAMSDVRSAVNSGVTIDSHATRDDSNLGQFLKGVGSAALVLLCLFGVYLVINHMRRLAGQRRRARRRASRRRSRRYE